MHLKDLIKVQEYEENESLQLIEEEQKRNRKPVNIVDVRKKFHLKQLAKKKNKHNFWDINQHYNNDYSNNCCNPSLQISC